ncbi:MAG: hypothetical protein ACOYB2_19735 [Limnohabitans sp.]
MARKLKRLDAAERQLRRSTAWLDALGPETSEAALQRALAWVERAAAELDAATAAL